MSSIDKRVVEMQFKNDQFESAVTKSLSTIDKLKGALKFPGATDGMTNIENTSSKLKMQGLSDAVETIKGKFSALGIIGITALQNITNSAIEAGKRVGAALTIDPMKDGFSEYENKINSIQVIMSNTQGKNSLEEVEASIQDLNLYADKTIYNFAEMTRNMGTFTAAGVGLQDAQASIKGIANLAAASGADSTKASTAMYQLSQALASGTVRLQDWMSVEHADMGGKLFQDALMQTADGMGIVYDKSENFRLSLQSGWLTSEVLLETLKRFSTDESMLKAATQIKTITQLIATVKEAVGSGWGVTWETLLGGYAEVPIILGKAGDAISAVSAASAKTRNDLLRDFVALGGRDEIIRAISNSFNAVVNAVRLVESEFHKVFPAQTPKGLLAIVASVADLTENFKIGGNTLKYVKNALSGVFAIMGMLSKVLGIFTGSLKSSSGAMLGIVNTTLKVASALGIYLTKMNATFTTNEKVVQSVKVIQIIFGTFAGILGNLASIAGSATKAVIGFFTGFMSGINVNTVASAILDGLRNLADFIGTFYTSTAKLADAMDAIVTSSNKKIGDLGLIKGSKIAEGAAGAFNVLGSAFGFLGKVLIALFEIVKNTLNPVLDEIQKTASNLNVDTVLAAVQAGLSGGALAVFVSLVNGIKEPMETINGLIKNNPLSALSGVMEEFKNTLVAYQTKLKAEALLKVAAAIGVLAISLLLMASIPADSLSRSAGALVLLMGSLTGMYAMMSMSKGVPTKYSIFDTMGTSLIKMGIAIGILALALKTISKIEPDALARSLAGIMTLMGALVATSAGLQASNKGAKIGGASLIGLSVALLIMTKSLTSLSKIDSESMGVGLGGMLTMLAAVGAFITLTNFEGFGMTKALAIMEVAVAIRIVTKAVETLGAMSAKALEKGLLAITGILAAIGGFVLLMNKSKHMATTAVSLILIATALAILGKVVENIGNMDAMAVIVGLAGLAAALDIVVIAINLLPKKTPLIAAGLVVLSVALIGIAAAFTIFSGLSLEQVGIGLLALGGSLGIIAGAMALMKTALPGALALLVVAGALTIFVPALLLLGSAPIPVLITALVAFAVALGVITLAATLMTPAIPAILAMAGALLIISVAIAVAGAGALLLTTALVALAGVTATTAAAIVASLSIIVIGIAATIPEVIKYIGKGVIEVAKQVIKAAPLVAKAVAVTIKETIKAIADATPAILKSILKMVVAILKILVDATPKIVEAGADIVIALLKGITKKMPLIVEGVADLIVAFCKALGSQIGALIDAGMKLMIDFINGLADGIRNNTAGFIAAFNNLLASLIEVVLSLLQTLVNWIGGPFGKFLSDGIDKAKAGVEAVLNPQDAEKVASKYMQGTIDGINGKAHGVVQAVKDTSAKALSEFNAGAGGIKNAGVLSVNGYTNAIAGGKILANTAARATSKYALAGVVSYEPSWYKSGQNSVKGYYNGTYNYRRIAVAAGSNVGWAALHAANSVLAVKSPSRKFAETGMYSVLGFALGVSDNIGKVATAGKSIGQTAITAVTKAVSSVGTVLDNTGIFDLTPVIKPVVDLTDVSKSASTIGRLFNDKTLISGTAKLDGSTGGRINDPSQPVYSITINASSTSAKDLAKEVEKIIVRR